MKPLPEEVIFHGVVKCSFCNHHKVCDSHLHNFLLENKISNLNIHYLKKCNQELALQYLYRKVLPIPVLEGKDHFYNKK